MESPGIEPRPPDARPATNCLVSEPWDSAVCLQLVCVCVCVCECVCVCVLEVLSAVRCVVQNLCAFQQRTVVITNWYEVFSHSLISKLAVVSLP